MEEERKENKKPFGYNNKKKHKNKQPRPADDTPKEGAAPADRGPRPPKKKKGKPTVHDGLDDIKMNPRYVVFDTPEDDDSPAEDVREGRNGAAPGAVVGRNAVRELLRSGRTVDKIYVKNGNREGSIVVIVAEAVSRKIPIVEVDQNKLDRLAGHMNHQGVVAMASEIEYTTVDGILKIAEDRGEKPLIVIADCIEDPHNLGALIRCAECAGVHGIIIPKRRAVGVTPVVARSSAGAIEHMAIAKVTNIANTIEELKAKGVWVFAAEADGEAYYDSDFSVPAAIVFGSEGNGVGKLIKSKSDYIVSIPMYGLVNSLNVSTAASVILCHAARVRHGK